MLNVFDELQQLGKKYYTQHPIFIHDCKVELESFIAKYHGFNTPLFIKYLETLKKEKLNSVIENLKKLKLPIAQILKYHDKKIPFYRLYSDEEYKNGPFLGIELEVNRSTEDKKEEISKLANEIRQIFTKENGASNDINFLMFEEEEEAPNGFEIITQPATYAFHKKLYAIYKEICEKAKEHGMQEIIGNEGLDVHVNRDFFGEGEDNAIKRVLKIVYKFQDQIETFARRKIQRRWYKIPKDIDEYFQKNNKKTDIGDRNYALNLTNQKTIEFRMFATTLDPNVITSTLELVNNIVTFAKEKDDEKIANMEFQDLLKSNRIKEYWAEAEKRKSVVELLNPLNITNATLLNNLAIYIHKNRGFVLEIIEKMKRIGVESEKLYEFRPNIESFSHMLSAA